MKKDIYTYIKADQKKKEKKKIDRCCKKLFDQLSLQYRLIRTINNQFCVTRKPIVTIRNHLESGYISIESVHDLISVHFHRRVLLEINRKKEKKREINRKKERRKIRVKFFATLPLKDPCVAQKQSVSCIDQVARRSIIDYGGDRSRETCKSRRPGFSHRVRGNRQLN